ncbi:MAG: hypothetical protein PHC88_09285 [Terrimicrobiaceae bacterium]|nr:hypothetical protein [Terrimicrobiaceae bacterium]
MKILLQSSRLLAILALLAFAAGCATEIHQKENLLTAAGFKTKSAATPRQIALLASLPPGKVSPVTHHGRLLFVFPDASQNILYVGRQQEYTAYRQLRLAKQLADENLAAAQLNQAASWDSWEGFSDGWYAF